MRTNGKYLLAAGLLSLLCACGKGSGFDATGTFEATEVIVSAEVNGRIMQYDVDEGIILKAGQQVGYIDTTQLYLQKMQLTANARSVRSRAQDVSKQIASTREEIAKAQFEKRRNEKLLASNASTQKQIDDLDSQIAVLEKKLAAQISTLQNSNTSITEESSALEIQVAAIEDMIRKSILSSPIDGTVLANYTQAGELAAPGKALFKVADTGNMYLRAYITSSQLADVKIGQQVKVFSDYGDDIRKEYPGTVKWIADKAEFTPKTIQTKDERADLVYAVKIAVPNDGYIKIGMYGEVKLSE